MLKRESRFESEAPPVVLGAARLLMKIPHGQRKTERMMLGVTDPAVRSSFERVKRSIHGVGIPGGERGPALLVYHHDVLEEKDVRIVLGKRGLSDNLSLRMIRSAQPEAAAIGQRVRHEQSFHGTATCRVRKPGGGETFVLGTNHVLANCNKGRAGDRIMSDEAHVGDLYAFENLSSHPDATNVADAALYTPKSGVRAGGTTRLQSPVWRHHGRRVR